jgi:hypothetical protein
MNKFDNIKSPNSFTLENNNNNSKDGLINLIKYNNNENTNRNIFKKLNQINEIKEIKEEENFDYDNNNNNFNDKNNKKIEKNSLEKINIEENLNQNKRILKKIPKVFDSFSDNSENEGSFVKKFDNLIISPKNKFKKIFDFLLILICFRNICMHPVRIIQINVGTLNFFEIFCDIIYILDFLSGFFLGFFDDNKFYLRNLKKNSLNYLFSFYFFIDFLCAIPFNTYFDIYENKSKNKIFEFKDLLYYNFTNSHENEDSEILFKPRILLIFRLLNLLKIFKILNFKNILFIYNFNLKKKDIDRNNKKINIEIFTYSKLYKYLKIFIYHIMISHIFSCLFIFIGTLKYPNWIISAKLKDLNFINLYITSFYFFNLNVFTIGLVDITPKNIYERIFSIIIMIFGVIFYSYILANLIELFRERNDNRLLKIDNHKEISNEIQTLTKENNEYNTNYNHDKTKSKSIKIQIKNRLIIEEKKKKRNIFPQKLT